MSEFKSSLSQKKEAQLYSLIHDKIMDARVKISLDKDISAMDIDNILSSLCFDAPQKAIELFKVKSKN